MPTPSSCPPDDDCEIVEIHTTFSSRDRADACATRLVSGRLAACVQVEGPLQSTYRWQGGVENATEWRCVCKTAPGRAAACLQALAAGHEYQVPELVVARRLGSREYAAWVRDAVTE